MCHDMLDSPLRFSSNDREVSSINFQFLTVSNVSLIKKKLLLMIWLMNRQNLKLMHVWLLKNSSQSISIHYMPQCLRHASHSFAITMVIMIERRERNVIGKAKVVTLSNYHKKTHSIMEGHIVMNGNVTV